MGFLLLSIATFNAQILLPFNKLWMRFGFLLGLIVSPLVLALIFFTLFTPIAITTRIFGRDELRLILKKRKSHWIKRDLPVSADSFKLQY